MRIYIFELFIGYLLKKELRRDSVGSRCKLSIVLLSERPSCPI